MSEFILATRPAGLNGYLDDWWTKIKNVVGDEPTRDLFGFLTAALDLWAERENGRGGRIHRHVPPALSARTRRWARPAYQALYDPDGRPRRMRGTTRF